MSGIKLILVSPQAGVYVVNDAYEIQIDDRGALLLAIDDGMSEPIDRYDRMDQALEYILEALAEV